MIRKAEQGDVKAIAAIYDAIHDLEEAGAMTTGWVRGVYPTEATARAAVTAGEMYVLEEDGHIAASGRINREQMPAYAQVAWQTPARDDQVLVLHTLTVDPARSGRGHARRFLRFYEDMAAEMGCVALRIDTNARNTAARKMYARHGYRESGTIPCEFNGIPGVALVCMEKRVERDG